MRQLCYLHQGLRCKGKQQSCGCYTEPRAPLCAVLDKCRDSLSFAAISIPRGPAFVQFTSYETI